ncbi:pantetheine-phosphate adenylyltransferase [Lactobacillus acetotolerans]|uniref:pantetheine-phosphate adenylyltransferase n=1 Tax=Lactobacillus acetotolerans TaxID=1600 RepID=UPI0007BAD93A|nr:pantetheine-phosphate adenylyltransferase [Lactobacillus acetotolerans]QGV04493.1 pantetheine-phosphate adenylyltransferase [Lactobacillus acetotolerans]
MTVALFPGSYDPITNGHVDIALKAAQIFDKVYVAVMTNTTKQYIFSADERVKLVQDALKGNSKIAVLKRPDALTVNVARELGASVIVRGVRNSEDFRYEQQIAGINKQLDPDVQTVLMFTDPKNSFVASSMIKEVAKFSGDVSAFLPEKSAQALREKMRRNHAK